MNGRILIVDDEETLCYFLRESLEEKGYRAHAVHTAREGLQELARQPVDLILLDLKLPDGEGLEVLQEIRKVDEGLPVIVLTGHAAVDSAVRAMKLGAYDYLEKPINLAQLSSSVADALKSLGRRRSREAEVAGEPIAEIGIADTGEPRIEAASGEAGPGVADMASLSQRLREVEGALSRAEVLNDIWSGLLRCSRVHQLAEAAAEGLIRSSWVDMVAIFVGGEEGGLVLASQRRCPPGLWAQNQTRRLSLSGVLGQALVRWEKPLPLSEAGPDPWVEAVSAGLGNELATALVPLRDGTSVWGLMFIGRRGRREYAAREMEFFHRVGEGLCSVLGFASQLNATAERLDWLSAQEEGHRVALESMPQGLVVVDGQGSVRLVNPAAERFLDCQEGEVVGQGIERLLGADGAMIRDSLDHGLPYEQQAIELKKDSGTVSLIMSVSPLWGASGAANGAVVTLNDLAQVREAEEERRRADRLAVLAGISGVVAHEIRNPLAGMTAGIQHLLTKVEQEDEKYQSLQRILKEGERVNRVIEDILLITRSPHLDLELCDLSGLVKGVASRWQETAQRAGVQVREYHSPGMLPIQGDQGRLGQALGNLVLNGIEAMPNGGTLDITVLGLANEGGEFAEVEIRDRGMGIGEEQLEKIFEPFYTTKAHAAGLGLTLAQRIVQEHGGELDVESEEGIGTKVVVRLPLARRVGQ